MQVETAYITYDANVNYILLTAARYSISMWCMWANRVSGKSPNLRFYSIPKKAV